MLWSEICQKYPNQWLVIEAIQAHTLPDTQRQFDDIAVIQVCNSGNEAMQQYRQLHLKHPAREFYFVHTSRTKLDVRERQWVGIRRQNAAIP
ncbi:MAG: hypothetical protein OHK0052_21990 [Anaerolineales bacterium]